MKIETKFDSGEDVYVIGKESRKVEIRKVLDINIKVVGGSELSEPKTYIEYSLDYSAPHYSSRTTVEYSEKECFKTKQELLESL